MILRYGNRIVKQDHATSHHPHQWSDLSNQGKYKAYFISIVHASFILNTGYRLDLHEDTEKNVVTATFEFPGFSKDEVQINFQNGKLTVSAETKKSEHNGDTGYTFNERLHGKFSRTLQLPQGIQVCRSFLNLLVH